jgi:hypothetical protein
MFAGVFDVMWHAMKAGGVQAQLPDFNSCITTTAIQ